MTEWDKIIKKMKHKLKIEQTPLWNIINKRNSNENSIIKRYSQFIHAHNDWNKSSRIFEYQILKKETSYLLKNNQIESKYQ